MIKKKKKKNFDRKLNPLKTSIWCVWVRDCAARIAAAASFFTRSASSLAICYIATKEKESRAQLSTFVM